jgi:dolichol kinase
MQKDMEKIRFLTFPNLTAHFSVKNIDEFKSEIIRKAIHFLIALTPFMAVINKPFTVVFLMIGISGYAVMEYLRLSGIEVPVISSLTSMASRPREINRFVMGPVTLGLGALLALLLFPSHIAAIAIYALAFGDGFAGLIGKCFGKWRPAFLCGKSIEGSFACFFMVFISAYAVSGSIRISVIAAFTAMVIESLPLEDYDNLILPVTVGFAVKIVTLF